jgi:RNA polymerase sigma factor (TIGR02999 family)
MGVPETGHITKILEAINSGDRDAFQKLFPLVYDRLHRMARYRMAHEPHQTLQTTALVHEVYLRLSEGKQPSWENKRHFFGVAAEAMKRILVENARKRASLRRGGGTQKLEFSENLVPVYSNPELYLTFDKCLELLRSLDVRMYEVVKLRCFGGLTVEETAEAMRISPRAVDRDWAAARAWLYHKLTRSTQ